MEQILLFIIGVLVGYYIQTMLFAEKTAWFVQNLSAYRSELHAFYEQGNTAFLALDKLIFQLGQQGVLTLAQAPKTDEDR